MAPKTRILLVDNDINSLSKLYLKLVHKGITAEASNDLGEVEDRIKRFKPHIVVISQIMIGEDAGAYCKRLKTTYRIYPVLVVEPDDRTDYIVDYIKRPVDLDRLLDLVSLYKP